MQHLETAAVLENNMGNIDEGHMQAHIQVNKPDQIAVREKHCWQAICVYTRCCVCTRSCVCLCCRSQQYIAGVLTMQNCQTDADRDRKANNESLVCDL